MNNSPLDSTHYQRIPFFFFDLFCLYLLESLHEGKERSPAGSVGWRAEGGRVHRGQKLGENASRRGIQSRDTGKVCGKGLVSCLCLE